MTNSPKLPSNKMKQISDMGHNDFLTKSWEIWGRFH